MVNLFDVSSKGVGSIQRTLNFNWLNNGKCLLPPIEEQKKIVAFLDKKITLIESCKCQRERELQTLNELKQAEIASVAARGWFADSGIEVLNEAPLLGTDGAEVRPDRVVLRPDGSAAVIDYKFGQPEKKYLDQVRGYMDLYRALGRSPVTGTLWYIREDGEDEFVEV